MHCAMRNNVTEITHPGMRRSCGWRVVFTRCCTAAISRLASKRSRPKYLARRRSPRRWEYRNTVLSRLASTIRAKRSAGRSMDWRMCRSRPRASVVRDRYNREWSCRSAARNRRAARRYASRPSTKLGTAVSLNNSIWTSVALNSAGDRAIDRSTTGFAPASGRRVANVTDFPVNFHVR